MNLVPEVSRVCLARREMKDPEDSLDLQAQLVCRAYLVHLVRKVKLEMLVKWVHQAPLVLEVPQDPQEPMVLRDLLAVLETPVLSEKREIPVKRENQGPREKLAHQVQEESEEKRERLVRLVLLDLLARKDPLETMVQKAAQVQVVSLVTLVPLESLVQLA